VMLAGRINRWLRPRLKLHWVLMIALKKYRLKA
jgi:hypothetical protein